MVLLSCSSLLPQFLTARAKGKGSSIIDILEVVKSDFTKNLATEESEESDAAAAYEKGTQDYMLTKATKEQDAKYKENEYTSLDEKIAEASADKDTTSTELVSVMEYDAKLKDRRVEKPETYESRRARREAEIAGLKEALEILETVTAFIQHSTRGCEAASKIFAECFYFHTGPKGSGIP